MVRSMYSGVAGMKSNQTRMDVIGNNIANSNTYGFKSSRATFRDMYYQQLRGASAGTATRGGINPSMVGYGSSVSSVDLLMTQSAMTSTGNPLDVCITGEGFLQVMDPDGNIYYTKAGMLDIDSNGYVIDSSGNFVLGTGATEGRLDSTEPGKSKIKIDVAPIQASAASVSSEISGRTLTISSTNQNKAANVGFTFTKSTEMPMGQRVKAIMDGTSSVINIQLNAEEEFTDMGQLESEINKAITEAYGGTHPGGDFKFTMEPDPFKDADGNPIKLTGAEIITTADAQFTGGEIKTSGTLTDGTTAVTSLPNGFSIKETGLQFSGNGDVDFSFTKTGTAPDEAYKFTLTLDGKTYQGSVPQSRTDKGSGSILLEKNPKVDGDTVTIGFPGTDTIENLLNNGGGTYTGIGVATPSEPTKNVGLGKGTFTLTGGTEFTEQNIGNLTGISIGADGTIVGTSAAGLQVLGRIDLATFANPKGLMQSGSTYFTETSNSGSPKLAIPGEEGTGALKNSALEMSNVDLAQEFSDMITTQRGFQASSRLITVSDTMLEELINLKR